MAFCIALIEGGVTKGTHDVGFGKIRRGELTRQGQTSDCLEAYLLTNCEQHGQLSHWPGVLILLCSRGTVVTTLVKRNIFSGTKAL